MPAEFENGRITNFAVLLAETKFCRQNLEIIPASCKREAKTVLFYAVFKFYRHRLNGVLILSRLTVAQLTIGNVLGRKPIEDCPKDGIEELFTEMHCVRITNF